MKITVELDDLLEPALQEHLENGTSMQTYVRAALIYFNEARKLVRNNEVIGFCGKESYTRQKGYIKEFMPVLTFGKRYNKEDE